MVPTIAKHGGSGVEATLAARRAELAGPSGLAGLLQNGRTTLIAVVAALGGYIYGFSQGVFSGTLSQPSFTRASGVEGIQNATLAGLLTSILELGAWVGVLANGYLADKLGRKMCTVVGCCALTVGIIIQVCTHGGNYDYILAGRTITGLGVGSLSMIVPLYNAELAAPQLRGSLVALQQLAITCGIMVAYWVGYGCSFIGGTGENQSKAAWLIPMTIQLVPAAILVVSMIFFLPESPRWLMCEGREQEALSIIAGLRRLPEDDLLVQMEYLELKAQKVFEDRVSAHDHPQLQDDSRSSKFKLGLEQYKSLFTNRSNLRRTLVAVLVMFFQQFSAINGVLYYAPFLFKDLGLDSGNTISLLATGVVGVAMFLATIPAVLYIDKWGRKPTLILGALAMAACHFSVAIIIATCSDNWAAHKAAGWIGCTFIWLFAVAFGISWGPVAWIVTSEVFPLGLRAKGVSIGASSNWLNNFAVAMLTPDFVEKAKYGAYIFFGAMCIIGATYVFFFVPETKQRTLDELDELFGDNSGRSRWEAEQMLQAQRDVGLLRLAGISEDGAVSPMHEKDDASSDHEKKDGDLAIHTA